MLIGRIIRKLIDWLIPKSISKKEPKFEFKFLPGPISNEIVEKEKSYSDGMKQMSDVLLSLRRITKEYEIERKIQIYELKNLDVYKNEGK